MNSQKKINKIIVFSGLSILAFTYLYPVVFMFYNSFKTKQEYRVSAFSWPTTFNWDNYKVMLYSFSLIQSYGNTLYIALISISITMVIAIFASYGFAKLEFKGRNFVYVAIICTMFVPAQVTMIPMYYLFAKFNMIDTYTAVILTYIAGGLPGTILLLTANFRGISKEMIEAAKMDGAGYFQVVKHIIIPMGMPVIAINIILAFISQSNDLFTPMILLPSMEKRTAIVALSSIMSRTSGDPAFQLTGLFLSILPPLIVFMALQKYLVKGISAGSLK
jgi:ABC-type glycerol-3-phosphate transport system permease component